MSSWVIDSSIGFSWVYPNQSTDATIELLKSVEAGSVIIVPSLWFIEIANGLLVLQRRKKLIADERHKALQVLSNLNLTVDEQPGRSVFAETSQLAERYELTIYDATYLELALRRNIPLASRDKTLIAAANRAGAKLRSDLNI